MTGRIASEQRGRQWFAFERYGWLLFLLCVTPLGALVAYVPEVGLAVLGGIVAILCVLALWRMSLTTFTGLFIFLVCFTAWIPLSIDVVGLNLRASQIMLPLVFMRLWVQRSCGDGTQSSRLWLLLAGLLWSAFLFWTLANLDSYASFIQPLGRVFLLGLNLLHTVAIYRLVLRTGQVREALVALLQSVAILNGILLLITIGAALGITAFQGLIEQEGAPILVDGELISGTVQRFKFGGIIAGCASAAALVVVVCLLFDNRSMRSRWLWIYGGAAAVGIVLGFSRQGLVSLVGGLVVLGLYLILRGRLFSLLRVFAPVGLVLAMVIVILSQLPGTQLFFQAFAGRTSLLLQPEAYETGTVATRTSIWSAMLADVARNPFVGYGQDAYLKYMPPGEQGSHNFPLEVLHASGLFGFTMYTLFHLIVLVSAIRLLLQQRGSAEAPRLLLGAIGAFIAVWLATLTNLIFSNPTYWLVIGLLVAGTKVFGRGLVMPRTVEQMGKISSEKTKFQVESRRLRYSKHEKLFY